MVARGRHREKEDGGSRVCNRDTANSVENIEASTIVSNHDDYVEVLKIHCNTLYYAQIAICNLCRCSVLLLSAATSSGNTNASALQPQHREVRRPRYVGEGGARGAAEGGYILAPAAGERAALLVELDKKMKKMSGSEGAHFGARGQ